MGEDENTGAVHDLDVTVWVGKRGVESVMDELDTQLDDRDLVKVRFLRSALSGTSAAELAESMAEEVDAEIVDVRGHTGVFTR